MLLYWRRQWQPTPVLLPGKSHGRRSSPWGFEESTRLSDFTFTFHFHALGKEMAAHSSVLAWRIPGMGSLVGCHLWGRTESDTTEVTQQQQQWKCGVPTTGQPIPFKSRWIPFSLPHEGSHGKNCETTQVPGKGWGWAERPCSPLQSWLCTVHCSILPGARDPLHVGGQEPGTQHSEPYLTRPPDAGQRGSGHCHLGTQPDSLSPNTHLMSHML